MVMPANNPNSTLQAPYQEPIRISGTVLSNADKIKTAIVNHIMLIIATIVNFVLFFIICLSWKPITSF